MFDYIFLPQDKWSVIISNKHGIYKLLYEFSSDIGLVISEDEKISGLSPNVIEL